MTSVLVAALDRLLRTGDPMIYRVITCRYRDETTPDQVDELRRLMDDLDAALRDDVTVMYGPEQAAGERRPAA